jgi:hypothetical protein
VVPFIKPNRALAVTVFCRREIVVDPIEITLDAICQSVGYGGKNRSPHNHLLPSNSQIARCPVACSANDVCWPSQ